ncbi:endonuclease/exonuclease/phosphatase family protein [Botrimarina sp.]|uniref:endonuclease/exonuclease/phosphatase family protein n=1 Tax=Botrimarina sp. TaxID=2795802 RepID=UPI0032EC19E0
MQRLVQLVVLLAIAGGGWSLLSGWGPAQWREAAQRVGAALPEVAQGAGPAQSAPPPAAGAPQFAPPERGYSAPTIRVATFNIRVFGDKKAENPNVMDAIARVVKRFDVVAIQEIRTQDDNFIPRFLSQYVNAGAAPGGPVYDARVSPRLGRTTSTEQYAFLFNTSTIAVHPNFCSVVPDPDDRLHRPPYAALFRTNIRAPHTPFTFTLINVHVDPDLVGQELDALYGVYKQVQRARIAGDATEDDVILLGDFNTPVPAASPYRPNPSARSLTPSDLGLLARLPGLSPLVRRQATNTRGTRLYDNILISSLMTTEFVDRGVLDLQRDLGYSRPLTLEQAEMISDHLPVWGEFSAIEGRAYRSAAR